MNDEEENWSRKKMILFAIGIYSIIAVAFLISFAFIRYLIGIILPASVLSTSPIIKNLVSGFITLIFFLLMRSSVCEAKGKEEENEQK